MKPKFILALAGAVAAASAWGLTGDRNLVTLDVRDMPLRDAAALVARRTGQPVLVQTGLDALVTLRVHRMPAEEVLRILSRQARGEWGSVYALYSSDDARRALEAWALDDKEGEPAGWGGSQVGIVHPSRLMGPAARDGDTHGVTLHLDGVEAADAVLEMTDARGTRVLADDGVHGKVKAEFDETPASVAVSRIAGQLGARWTHFFALRRNQPIRMVINRESPGSGPGGGRVMIDGPGGRGPRPGGGPAALGPRSGGPPMLGGPMTPEAQAQIQADLQARVQQRALDDLQNLTPEQRVAQRRHGHEPAAVESSVRMVRHD